MWVTSLMLTEVCTLGTDSSGNWGHILCNTGSDTYWPKSHRLPNMVHFHSLTLVWHDSTTCWVWDFQITSIIFIIIAYSIDGIILNFLLLSYDNGTRNTMENAISKFHNNKKKTTTPLLLLWYHITIVFCEMKSMKIGNCCCYFLNIWICKAIQNKVQTMIVAALSSRYLIHTYCSFQRTYYTIIHVLINQLITAGDRPIHQHHYINV